MSMPFCLQGSTQLHLPVSSGVYVRFCIGQNLDSYMDSILLKCSSQYHNFDLYFSVGGLFGLIKACGV